MGHSSRVSRVWRRVSIGVDRPRLTIAVSSGAPRLLRTTLPQLTNELQTTWGSGCTVEVHPRYYEGGHVKSSIPPQKHSFIKGGGGVVKRLTIPRPTVSIQRNISQHKNGIPPTLGRGAPSFRGRVSQTMLSLS